MLISRTGPDVSGGLDTWAQIEASGSCDRERLPHNFGMQATAFGRGRYRRYTA